MKYAMHEISYTKHFLSGPLAGLAADCAYMVDSATCCRSQAALNAMTLFEPGAEALTGTLYWVSGVRCREVTHEHTQEHGIYERTISA